MASQYEHYCVRIANGGLLSALVSGPRRGLLGPLWSGRQPPGVRFSLQQGVCMLHALVFLPGKFWRAFPPSDPDSVRSSWRNPSLTLPAKVITLKINLICLDHGSLLK